jgi:hypothetical protein
MPLGAQTAACAAYAGGGALAMQAAPLGLAAPCGPPAGLAAMGGAAATGMGLPLPPGLGPLQPLGVLAPLGGIAPMGVAAAGGGVAATGSMRGDIIIPGFEPGKPVDTDAFRATHGAKPGAPPLKPLVTRGPGDGVPGAKPPKPRDDDGPSWTKPPEVIMRPGEHPRIKRDSGAWSGRKQQTSGLRMGGT